MLSLAICATLVMIVALKVVDVKGHKWFDDVTKVRTRIFGGVALGVVASLVLAIGQYVL